MFCQSIICSVVCRQVMNNSVATNLSHMPPGDACRLVRLDFDFDKQKHEFFIVTRNDEFFITLKPFVNIVGKEKYEAMMSLLTLDYKFTYNALIQDEKIHAQTIFTNMTGLQWLAVSMQLSSRIINWINCVVIRDIYRLCMPHPSKQYIMKMNAQHKERERALLEDIGKLNNKIKNLEAQVVHQNKTLEFERVISTNALNDKTKIIEMLHASSYPAVVKKEPVQYSSSSSDEEKNNTKNSITPLIKQSRVLNTNRSQHVYLLVKDNKFKLLTGQTRHCRKNITRLVLKGYKECKHGNTKDPKYYKNNLVKYLKTLDANTYEFINNTLEITDETHMSDIKAALLNYFTDWLV
ncbi:ORF104 protein [Operophtera brumata nucleopolyhedrovirus]|uniref:ORF104 protein n=1 Tax=Operophtera brumata nucleopolyhedrovirus TaxID=1046267 RepID=A0A2H4UZZ5_9ABAC|nr:ORF104 protein [Operophtera brumata nucleopolyhedrovirus]AUA60335.1 ORF104 protein [Operophtera brumata nucleopolyhedrovirus]